MGIPPTFTLDAMALHCLVAAKNIFDRSGHDVMDTGHTICGGRAFVEDKAPGSSPFCDTSLKDVAGFPKREGFPVYFRQVECFEFSVHWAWIMQGRLAPTPD